MPLIARLIIVSLLFVFCSCGTQQKVASLKYTPSENNQMVLNTSSRAEASFESDDFLVNVVYLKNAKGNAIFGVLVKNYSESSMFIEPRNMFVELKTKADSVYRVVYAMQPDSLLNALDYAIEASDQNLRKAYTAETVTYAATAVFGLISILSGESYQEGVVREVASFAAQVGTTINSEVKANQLDNSIRQYHSVANEILFAESIEPQQYIAGEVHFPTHSQAQKMNVCVPIAGDTLRFEFVRN